MHTYESLLKKAKSSNSGYSEKYLRIDNCIQPFVDYINNLGFITIASCGSHLVDFQDNPCKIWEKAYVNFYIPNDKLEVYYQLKKKKFPKSYGKIHFEDGLFDHQAIIRIIFYNNKKRIEYLKEIYDFLSIPYGDIYLEPYRRLAI